MKNKMILVVIMAVVLSLGMTKVLAEELAPTDTGSYFETKVLPYIVGGGSGAVGALAGFVGLIRKTKKTASDTTKTVTDATSAALAKVETATAELEVQATKITEFQKDVTDKVNNVGEDVKGFKETALKTIEEQKKMIDAQTEVIKGFQGQIAKITSDQAKTTQAILIGFGNNAELVKNGYAKTICDLMEKPVEG